MANLRRHSAEIEQKRRQRSLAYSIEDGRWYSIMSGATESYLGALAVHLRATALQISLLGTFPLFLGAILPLFGVKLTNLLKSRKSIVVLASGLQVLVWLLVVLLTLYFQNIWLLILLAGLFHTMGGIAGPAWVSWMGDLVPEDERGRYFGKRNRIIGIIAFIATVGAGIILDRSEQWNVLWGFAIIFSIGAFARLVSVTYLLRQYEPTALLRPPKTSFLDFMREIKKSPFGIFTLYSSLMQFAVNIAAPIFILIWLDFYQFNYIQYTALIAAAAISGFATMIHWGKYADRYGNTAILEASSHIVIIVPLLWCLPAALPDFLQLPVGLSIQLMSGFGWAGFNLAASNIIYDFIEPSARVRFLSFHNAIKGTAILIGGLCCALLVRYIDFSLGLLAILVISTFLRYVVFALYSNRIHEVRIVPKRPHFWHFATVLPMQGLVYDSVVGLNRTKKIIDRHVGIMKKAVVGKR